MIYSITMVRGRGIQFRPGYSLALIGFTFPTTSPNYLPCPEAGTRRLSDSPTPVCLGAAYQTVYPAFSSNIQKRSAPAQSTWLTGTAADVADDSLVAPSAGGSDRILTVGNVPVVAAHSTSGVLSSYSNSLSRDFSAFRLPIHLTRIGVPPMLRC